MPEMRDRSRDRAESLRIAILTHLWDAEQGLFFEGLNTPTPTHLIGAWMPENVKKRYYRLHANILAAYFGIFDQAGCADLIDRIMNRADLGEVQPYFAHFLLEAIYHSGLRNKYTLAVLDRWKAPVADCPGGLVEGFYPPHPDYGFDHSHAWGGTPLWSLPLALSGLAIEEPGMRVLSLDPDLLGMAWARVEIPTPHGILRLSLAAGREPIIEAPAGITVRLR
jgi:hypothetical protein